MYRCAPLPAAGFGAWYSLAAAEIFWNFSAEGSSEDGVLDKVKFPAR
jgi:hypothetical protein